MEGISVARAENREWSLPRLLRACRLCLHRQLPPAAAPAFVWHNLFPLLLVETACRRISAFAAHGNCSRNGGRIDLFVAPFQVEGIHVAIVAKGQVQHAAFRLSDGVFRIRSATLSLGVLSPSRLAQSCQHRQDITYKILHLFGCRYVCFLSCGVRLTQIATIRQAEIGLIYH